MLTQGDRLRAAMRLAGYKTVTDFAEVCGLPAGTIRQQINRGSLAKDDAGIYVRKLRRVGVTADWLLFGRGAAPGEKAPADVLLRPAEIPPPGTVAEVAVLHFIGAGDLIHIIDTDEGFDYTDAPPGFERGAAGIVRGDSMRPAYDDGEILFWRSLEEPPKKLPDRAVIVKVKDGPLYLKQLIPGSKRRHFHLQSINPLTRMLLDQEVEAIARIGWVKKVERV